MNRQWASGLTAVGLCLWPSEAYAADAENDIVTDRPDFVESSVTVGKGHFQIETSLRGERHTDEPLHENTLNTPTLLRLGVTPDWELRLETEGYTRLVRQILTPRS